MKTIYASGAVVLLLSAHPQVFGGYHVTTRVEAGAHEVRYVWEVHNQNQESGLDVFVVEVPSGTKAIAYTVPSPFSNPAGSGARWVFFETDRALVDPHSEKNWLEAPPAGRKWLVWAGEQPPSVYPARTTATFSFTTDSSLKPGAANAVAATYTPQRHPDYYQPFSGSILAPGGAADPDHSRMLSGVQFDVGVGFRGRTSAPNPSLLPMSLDLYPGITIEGEVGRTYGIQFRDNMANGKWQGLMNVTLGSSREIWFDAQPATQHQRFYRVVPGPIEVP